MLSTAELKEYKSKMALPTIAIGCLTLVAYVWVFLNGLNSSISPLWLIVINTPLAYIFFSIMHEAAHANISGDNRSLQWINELFGWVSGIALFAPFYLFKVIHFRHHAFTNDPQRDPDHWLASKNVLALLFHSTTIFPVYFIKGFQLLFLDQKVSKLVKKELRLGFIGLFVMIAAAVFLAVIFGIMPVLYTWIIPAFLAQILLAIAFDWLPHHPHDTRERYLDTRVLDIPAITHLMLFQNYHLIHHLYPRIPFYDYKKVFHKIEDELKEKGTEIIG